MNTNKKWLIKLIIATFIISLLVWFIMPHLVLVTSSSISHRILWKTAEQGRKNDYALFYIQNPWLSKYPIKVTKFIACGPHDELTSRDHKFFCNGKILAEAKQISSNNTKLPTFHFNGKIPPGMGFALGSNENSYDSRYIGLIDLSKTYKLIVIL